MKTLKRICKKTYNTIGSIDSRITSLILGYAILLVYFIKDIPITELGTGEIVVFIIVSKWLGEK